MEGEQTSAGDGACSGEQCGVILVAHYPSNRCPTQLAETNCSFVRIRARRGCNIDFTADAAKWIGARLHCYSAHVYSLDVSRSANW